VISAKSNLGFALGGMGKISEGLPYIEACLNYYKSIEAQAEVAAILADLASMYETHAQYQKALHAVREMREINKDILRNAQIQSVAKLQEKFDADQRKKQVDLLEKEKLLKDATLQTAKLNQTMIALVGVALSMLGIFVVYSYRQVRNANKTLIDVNQQLEQLSSTDPLTGLQNRRTFMTMMQGRIPQEQERRLNHDESSHCLIILDIDFFKQINDNYGHAAGDQVLIEVARRLKHAVRDQDKVLRWGGEEFLIYTSLTALEQIQNLVERILFL